MKRTGLCLLLTAMVLLTGCASRRDPLPETTLIPGTDATLPTVSEARVRENRDEATLWFRFLDEPYLAPETRVISQRSSQSYEMALLTALFDGPGTQHTELRTLFPEGTYPLSTVRQGRRLLVTVSHEFLGTLRDEPADWRSDPGWREEIPLRRQLCMQSIVATVTENCDVDEVVVLVEQRDVISDSMRLRQSWFMLDEEDDAPAPAQTRQDTLLLTSRATAEAVLTCWQRCDWERLYKYIAAVDPFTGEARPEYKAFVTRMSELRRILAFDLHDCYIRDGGEEATASATFRLRMENGSESLLEARCLRLHRDGGIWKIGMSGLTGWMDE